MVEFNSPTKIKIGVKVIDGVANSVLFLNDDGELQSSADFTYVPSTNTFRIDIGNGFVVSPQTSTFTAIGDDDGQYFVFRNGDVRIQYVSQLYITRGGVFRALLTQDGSWGVGIIPEAIIHGKGKTTTDIGGISEVFAGSTVNIHEFRLNGAVVAAVTKNGGIKPAEMADTSAENSTIYYSTTASKLVYKDSGGTVNNLY